MLDFESQGSDVKSRRWVREDINFKKENNNEFLVFSGGGGGGAVHISQLWVYLSVGIRLVEAWGHSWYKGGEILVWEFCRNAVVSNGLKNSDKQLDCLINSDKQLVLGMSIMSNKISTTQRIQSQILYFFDRNGKIVRRLHIYKIHMSNMYIYIYAQ